MPRASTLSLFLVVASWNESVGFIFTNTRSTVKRSAALNIAPIKNVEAFMGVDTTIRENDSKLNFPLNKNKFDGNVDIELGEGYKTMTENFSPSWEDGQCSLACVEASLPLGMIIEESEKIDGKFEIVEVLEGSNAEKAGVRVGDMFRACSAQRGPPPNANVAPKKALFDAEGMNFEACMNALGTNSPANGGTGRVALIFERRYQ